MDSQSQTADFGAEVGSDEMSVLGVVHLQWVSKWAVIILIANISFHSIHWVPKHSVLGIPYILF